MLGGTCRKAISLSSSRSSSGLIEASSHHRCALGVERGAGGVLRADNAHESRLDGGRQLKTAWHPYPGW